MTIFEEITRKINLMEEAGARCGEQFRSVWAGRIEALKNKLGALSVNEAGKEFNNRYFVPVVGN